MKFAIPTSISLFVLLGTVVADPTMADHNSVWGAGKANMPNDIHNTRIEEANAGLMTSEEWRDFVSKGAGAATENRYLDTDGDGVADRVLPSETTRNNGYIPSAQVSRGGRPDAPGGVSGMRSDVGDMVRPTSMSTGIGMISRPSADVRSMNASVDRPAMSGRGRR
jgi:hypothetical protein